MVNGEEGTVTLLLVKPTIGIRFMSNCEETYLSPNQWTPALQKICADQLPGISEALHGPQ